MDDRDRIKPNPITPQQRAANLRLALILLAMVVVLFFAFYIRERVFG